MKRLLYIIFVLVVSFLLLTALVSELYHYTPKPKYLTAIQRMEEMFAYLDDEYEFLSDIHSMGSDPSPYIKEINTDWGPLGESIIGRDPTRKPARMFDIIILNNRMGYIIACKNNLDEDKYEDTIASIRAAISVEEVTSIIRRSTAIGMPSGVFDGIFIDWDVDYSVGAIIVWRKPHE